MKAFVEPLQNLSGFLDMKKLAKKEKGIVFLSGCIDAEKPHMIYAFGREQKNKLIVTFHEQRAKELYEEYRFFNPLKIFSAFSLTSFSWGNLHQKISPSHSIAACSALKPSL